MRLQCGQMMFSRGNDPSIQKYDWKIRQQECGLRRHDEAGAHHFCRRNQHVPKLPTYFLGAKV